MEDDVWRRDEIASPCVRICVIHPTEALCAGCFRTADEIARWSRMTPAEREQIMSELSTRAPRLKKRRGGRAARVRD